MSSRFEELKLTGRLPSPAGVGLAILRLTESDDYSTEEIVRTIQTDPALTGRLLKLANSARVAGVRGATTVSEAVVRLGVHMVRNVALGFSLISSSKSGQCVEFDYAGFWSQSLARAVASQAASSRFRIGKPPEAYICGLLSGVGRLALASTHPVAYAPIAARSLAEPDHDFAPAEREAFGIDHREVALELLIDWGLPEEHAVAVSKFDLPERDRQDDSPVVNRIITALRFGCSVADVCAASDDRRIFLWPRLAEARESCGLDPDEFESFWDDVVLTWQEWGEVFGITTHSVPPVGHIEREHDDATAARDPKDDDILSILVVDDDPVTRKLVCSRLMKSGYRVFDAADGNEALAIALDVNPEIVVTDRQMPVMDGVEFCRALRRWEGGANVYIIMLTGSGESDQVVAAFDAGADDYVTKPFDPSVLLARIRAGERVVQLQAHVEKDKEIMERQVADMAVLNRKLHAASVTDPLTELPNRRYAMEKLREEWMLSVDTSDPLSVIMIDIDRFKNVNDTYGHDVGDIVLKEVAGVLAASIRKVEFVCRLGGEEFLVICPGSTVEGTAMCAERIRHAVEIHRIECGGFSGSVTISLGVADSRGKNVESLLKASDEAVYRAKESGRNRVVVDEPAPIRA